MEMSSLGTATMSLPLDDQSQVGEARRQTVACASELGFDEQDRGRVALVVTEIATNAVRHGAGGALLLRAPTENDGPIEVLVVDRGPGMADVGRALRDGYSTAGTPGSGLGAAARMSDVFDIYSTPEAGTILYAQFLAGRNRGGVPAGMSRGPARLAIGAVCLPQRGETVSGDAWASTRKGRQDLLMIADGLGHGPNAAAASQAAVRVFLGSAASSPAAILTEMHDALRSTRGAAIAVAMLDRETREICYAGVGNISGTIANGSESRSMVSHNGTVGHEMRKVHEFTYPWPADSIVVMHSDGLQTHWRLDRYPGLAARHPAVIAGLLYRDFTRGRDDVTALAARLP